MGSSAERMLDEKEGLSVLGKDFSNARWDTLKTQAENLCQTDYMPSGKALDILTGKTRKPYGSPKIKP